MAGAPSLAAIVKRQEKAAPELSALVKELTDEPLGALLPKLLEWSTLPWNRPRGDLCHWLPLLNRLDIEMKSLLTNYDFKTSKPVVLIPEHESILITIVLFTATLIENCANRVVYPSVPILSLLIETANIAVVSNTLFLLSKFLPRKGSNIATIEILSRHINAEKLIKMCTIIPTQISSRYIDLKDFYDLPPLNWAQGYTLVGGSSLSWPEDVIFIENADLPSLVSTTCETITETLWDGLRYRIWLAKAVMGDVSVRRHMIFTQCRSIAIALCILQEAELTAKLLAIRPNILNDIARLVTSSHIPELRLLGVQVFHHAISEQKSLLSAEVRRTKCLGIVTVLSQATRAAKLGEPIDEDFMSRLFSFARDAMWVDLTAMGIIPLCLEFLTIKTPLHLKSKTACCSFLNSLVMEVQAANTAFIEVNGVECLLNILVYEVDLTRVSETLMIESPPSFCIVDHDLSLDRVRWICSAVVLLANLLTLRRSSTLLRKVLDSPLLDVCAKLISNPDIFSGRNAALALDLVVALIKQDENTVQVLQEKNLMSKMLKDAMLLFSSRFRQYSAGLAFYVALSSICKSLQAPGNGNTSEDAISKAFDAIVDDMPNIPMFVFRQIGRATFSNAGIPKGELRALIHQLLRIFSKIKNNLTESSSISCEQFITDSDGTDLVPSGYTVSSLDAILHLAETSLEEPTVMSAFIQANGHMRLLETLAESPLPYDYSNRAAGKTRLVRLFKRAYQLSSDRQLFMKDCLEYFSNITRTLLRHVKDSAATPFSSANVTLLWATSSFCFTIQLISRIMFINTRSAAILVSFFRSDSGVAISDLVLMLGEIHQWALEQSAMWVSVLSSDMEWATNPVSARISSYMGPGVGLSGETTAADTEHVARLFRSIPTSARSEAQATKAYRWLLARVHILCTEFMGNISMYATADSIYELDPKSALSASQSVSEVYRANLNRAMTWDKGLSGRHASLYFLIDLRSILLNDRKYLNLGVFVLFVQSGGFGDFVKMVNRLICSQRDGAVASLYLAENCQSVDFYDDCIIFALDRLSELVSSPDYMGDSLHNTEFCVRSFDADEPEHFSMPQFLVELRIKILVDLKKLLPMDSWSKLPPLALEPLQEIFEFANLDIPSDDDEMSLPGSDFERSNLPLLILPETMFDWKDKISALTSTGSITAENAEKALREHEGSVRLVCQTLDIPLPPESLFEREQTVGTPPELNGRQYKVIEDLHLLRSQWRDWIGEYLLQIVDANPAASFYATKLLSKIVRDWSEMDNSKAREVLDLLISDVHSGKITLGRLCFLATLSGITWLCHHIRPQLAASLNQLTELGTGSNELLIAPALTLLEKVFVEDGSTAAIVSTWLETEALTLVHQLASTSSEADVTEVIIARFLLLLSWRSASYEISISLINLGLVDRFLSMIQRLAGSVMGQQLQLVTILLVRSVVEPDDVQARVFQSSLLKVLMTGSKRPEFSEHFNMFADIFARNPQLMLDICSKETVYDQDADVLAPRLLYEKFVNHINEHILKKGYDLEPVKKSSKTSQTPTARSAPKIEVFKMVYSLLQKLLSQPYTDAYEDALKFSTSMQESMGTPPLFDTAHPKWTRFRSIANYTHFLLVALYEICDVSEVARQAVLYYPQPIEMIPPNLSVMPEKISPSFTFLFQAACSYRTDPSSSSNPCHLIADSVANTAGQLLYSFTFMAAESFVTKEMVDIRTARTRYMCNIASALLQHHFGFTNMYEHFLEPIFNPARAKKLLESIVAVLNLALRQNSIQWQLVSPIPFIAITIISSKLPELISDCLGRIDISNPSFEAARADFYKFFRRISFYDSLDINNDHPMPSGEHVLSLEPPSDRNLAMFLGERDELLPVFRTIIEAPHPVDEYESIENDSDYEFDGVEYVHVPTKHGHQRAVNGAPEVQHRSDDGSSSNEEGHSEQDRTTDTSGTDESDFNPESSFHSDEDDSVDNALSDVSSGSVSSLRSQDSIRWREQEFDEDDGFMSYENVSDEDAASLASDGTGGSLGADSEMEHEVSEDEEMFSNEDMDSEVEDPMEFSLVLEPWHHGSNERIELSSDDDTEDGASDIQSIYFGDEMDHLDIPRTIGNVNREGVDDTNREQSASLQRASMLAQLYANDVDEDISDADSFNSNYSLDAVLEDEMFNFNPFEFELGLGMSGTGRLTNSLGGAGTLDIEGELGSEIESPRAFTVHPNTREDFSDVEIYRMDDGEPYYFQFEDIDIDKLLSRNPLLVEPHLLVRATHCIFGGMAPSMSERISPIQPGQLMSNSPAATTFVEFANERTKIRWASYLEFAGLPKRDLFARKLRQLFTQVNENDMDVDAEWLESLDDAADKIREIEEGMPSDSNLFQEGQDGIYLDEGAEMLTTSDPSKNGVPVYGRPQVERLWPTLKFKFSSCKIWASTITRNVILNQLRFVFVPWSSHKEAQLICDEVSSLSWDLFCCFVNGLFTILESVSSGESGVSETFVKLSPRGTNPSLATKTLESTSAELVLRQALLLLVFLQEKPKLRTLLVTFDNSQALTSGFAINKLLDLLDRAVFKHDSALMERLLFVIDEVTRTICEKASPDTTELDVIVSTQNLHRLMHVWTAGKSTSVAFNHAAHSIAHLGKVVSIEQLVSKQLLVDTEAWINKMIGELSDMITTAESEDSLTSKLTSYTSVQTMLLRASKVAKLKMVPGSCEFALELFRNKTLNFLMNKVSEVLNLAANPHSQFLRISSLKPLIETLLNFGRTAAEGKYAQERSSQAYIRSLSDFIDQHFKSFNELVRKNSHQFLSNTVEILKDQKQLLTFENRKRYFADEMGSFRKYRSRMAVPLKVSRTNLFHDSMEHLMKLEPFELRLSQLDVNFDGEEGIDQGGLNREWYSEMTKYIFHPKNGLFEQHASGLRPRVLPDSLDKFLFIGRFIGKAVVDGQLLDVVFSPPVYKFLLKENISLDDLKTVDEAYYNSLMWMLNNDITDVLDEVFAVEAPDRPGHLIDLIPDGSKVPVTEANKKEYIELRASWSLYKSFEPQLQQLYTGFYELMKFSLISLFNPKELELVIGGIPKIDITDWRLNTEYEGYSASSPQIRWFWRTVKSYDHAQRAKLLQFCTGSAKVPVDGFQHLPAGRFNISRDRRSPQWLPTAHTCTNHLCLPEYPSYEELRAAVSRAISDGAGSFGLA